jgi:hypothetical protein
MVEGRGLGDEVGQSLQQLIELFSRKTGPAFDWSEKHRTAFQRLFVQDETSVNCGDLTAREEWEDDEELPPVAMDFAGIQAVLDTTPPVSDRTQQAGPKKTKKGKPGRPPGKKRGRPAGKTLDAPKKRGRPKKMPGEAAKKASQGKKAKKGKEKRKGGRGQMPGKAAKKANQGKKAKKGKEKTNRRRGRNMQWEKVQSMRRDRNGLLVEGKRCAFGTGNVVFVKVYYIFCSYR